MTQVLFFPPAYLKLGPILLEMPEAAAAALVMAGVGVYPAPSPVLGSPIVIPPIVIPPIVIPPVVADLFSAAGEMLTSSFALLSGDTPEWMTTDKHRYIPRNQVNPLEFGAPRDDARPGTGILATLTNANDQPPQIDARQDVLGTGTGWIASGLTTALLKMKGGRYWRLHAASGQGAELDIANMSVGVFLEGYTGAFWGKPPRDGITWTANDAGTATFVGQDINIEGNNGTNLAEWTTPTSGVLNIFPASDLRMISATRAELTLAGDTALGLPLLDLVTASGTHMQEVLIYGTSYRGAIRNDNDFNQNWTVVGARTDGVEGRVLGRVGTILTLQSNGSNPAFTPGDTTGLNVATLWGTPTTGQNVTELTGSTFIAMGYQTEAAPPRLHPDSFQSNKDKKNGGVYFHRFRGLNGYQAFGIVGNSPTSDCDFKVSFATLASDNSQYPHDRATTLIFSAGKEFATEKIHEFYEVYCDNTARPFQTLNNMVYPNAGIRDYGLSTSVAADGRTFAGYLGGAKLFRGGYKLGKPDDNGTIGVVGNSHVARTGARTPGYGYQSRGYANLRAPVQADLAADPFVATLGLSPAPSGAPGPFYARSDTDQGVELGDIRINSTLPGNCVTDIYISDANGAPVSNRQVRLEGVILKRGPAALAAGVYEFYMTALVNVLDASFNRIVAMDGGVPIRRTKKFAFTVASTGQVTMIAATTQFVPQQPTVAGSIYTWGACQLGDANTVRDIIIPVQMFASAARTITSVKVNGKAAALVPGSAVTNNASSANYSITGVYRIALDASDGANGDVVITMSGASQGGNIGVEAVTGIGVGFDSATFTAAPFTAPNPVTVSVPAGGLVLAWAAYSSAASSGNRKGTYGKQIASAAGSITVTPTYTGGDLNFGGAFAETQDNPVSTGGTPATAGGVLVFAGKS